MPKPLRSRTLTYSELQQKTLALIEGVRKQFNRASWEDGLSDNEFFDEVCEPLRFKIIADIEMTKETQ